MIFSMRIWKINDHATSIIFPAKVTVSNVNKKIVSDMIPNYLFYSNWILHFYQSKKNWIKL